MYKVVFVGMAYPAFKNKELNNRLDGGWHRVYSIKNKNKDGSQILQSYISLPLFFGTTPRRIMNVETLGGFPMTISCSLTTVSARDGKNNSGQRTRHGGTIR